MRGKLAMLAVAGMVTILATPAWADTLHVPRKFATLQAAADVAKDGDTIRLAPGSYEGAVTVEGVRNLTIRGRGVVVLTPPAGGALATLHVKGCANIVLKRLTIANSAGTGLLIEDSPRASVVRCRGQGETPFEANRSDGVVFARCSVLTDGTGIAGDANATLTVDKCRIECESGATGIGVASSRIDVLGTTVSYDDAGAGRAISLAADGAVTLDRCTVTAKSSSAESIGVFAADGEDPVSTLLMRRCRVRGFEAGVAGVADSATYSRNHVSGTLQALAALGQNVEIVRNVARVTGDAAVSAAIVLFGSNGDVAQNTARDAVWAVLIQGDTNVVERNRLKNSDVGIRVESGNGNVLGPKNRFRRVTTDIDDLGTNTVEL